MAERFSAFSFVDRITAVDPGVQASARYAIPGHLPHFPASLVAEAIGQLAAWASMAALEFRRRPVAGLAGETVFRGGAAPGDALDLAVEIETCAADAVAYGGAARVGGRTVLELRHCVGPMLPMEEFDAPQAVRGDYEVLCGPGAQAGRMRALPECEVTVNERISGRAATATLHVPAAAPFFGDHFPRKPVFPGTLLLDRLIELALGVASEAAPGGVPAPVRVSDVKMRTFIAPGQSVELKVELVPQDDDGFGARLAARVGGKTVATGHATIGTEATA